MEDESLKLIHNILSAQHSTENVIKQAGLIASEASLTGPLPEPLALTSNDVPELNRMVNNCCISGTGTRIFNPSLDLRHLKSVMYVFGALLSFWAYWLTILKCN